MRERIGQWRSRASGAIKSFQLSRLTKSRPFLAASVLLTLVVGVFFIWAYPRQATSDLQGLTDLERLQAENDARATNAQIFLGISLLIGIWLTHRRVCAVEKQAESAARQADTAEQGQITERFTRAIEQLGKPGDDNLAIRLGGIYALERVMRDSARDFTSVREVLGAFVRYETTKAQNSNSDDASGSLRKPRTDVQAALTVLARNSPETGVAVDPIDLKGAFLERAELSGAKFDGAQLSEVHLEGADLSGATLKNAVLRKANLRYASLILARLDGADLEEANLERALLHGATLKRAILKSTTLLAAWGMTEKQLDGAVRDDKTILPEDLTSTSSKDHTENLESR